MSLPRCVVAGLVVIAVPVTPGAQEVFTEADDIVLPKPIHTINPEYTDAAMQARVEGRVTLEAVVRADGRVEQVAVVESLDTEYGLDQQAVDALRQWIFEPGTKDDMPVAVRIEVEMHFGLGA